jgi:hypothetical protein
MKIFHSHIWAKEMQSNSVIEVLSILNWIKFLLKERQKAESMPLKRKEQNNLLMDSEKKDKCIKFATKIAKLFTACLTYLEKWLIPLNELKCFEWMALQNQPQ